MLGNENNQNGKLFILKIKSKDESDKPVAPFFTVTEKIDGNWKVTSKVKDVQGRISKVEVEEKEWEQETYSAVKVYLNDDSLQETYLLDLRFNNLTRQLFNSLINVKDFGNVKIGLYEKTSKKDGKVYPNAAVREGEKLVNWKHELDALPKVVEIPIKGKKPIRDYSEINDFYVTELNKFADTVTANRGNKSEASVAENTATESTPQKPAGKRGPKPKVAVPAQPEPEPVSPEVEDEPPF